MALTDKLTAIADAIRAKTGETASMGLADMPDKISGISGGDTSTEDGVIDRSLTTIENDRVTKVGDYAFRGCTALTCASFKNALSIGGYAFYNCTALESFTAPAAQSIGSYAFYNCDALTALDFSNLTTLGANAFQNCSGLASVNLPMLTTIPSYAFGSCSSLTECVFPAATSVEANAFRMCSSLKKLDFAKLTAIANNAFYSATALETIILRNTSGVCSLAGLYALYGTKIAAGTGYVYVPSALLDDYKAASNWSSGADQIRAIEDYPDITGG